MKRIYKGFGKIRIRLEKEKTGGESGFHTLV